MASGSAGQEGKQEFSAPSTSSIKKTELEEKKGGSVATSEVSGGERNERRCPMGLTKTKRAFYDLRQRNDFISVDTLQNFERDLSEEGNSLTFSVGLKEFIMTSCVKCNAPGAFKWHFLGKLRHPDCGWTWYVSPGSYLAGQFRGAFRAGLEAGGDAGADAEKKGKKGYAETIFTFLFVSFFRLAFGLLMTPVQVIVSLAQSKPTEADTAIKKEALSHLKDALRLEPQKVGTRKMMAEAYLSLGDKVKALKEARLSLTLNPSSDIAKHTRNMISYIHDGSVQVDSGKEDGQPTPTNVFDGSVAVSRGETSLPPEAAKNNKVVSVEVPQSFVRTASSSPNLDNKTLRCKNTVCDKELPSDSVFCGYCGAKVV